MQPNARRCTHCQRANEATASFCGGCGRKLDAFAPDPYRVGATVVDGRYRLDAVLGEGSMGTVFRALDLSLQRTCALKVLNAELIAHPTARRRMQQEARILARISHPNVVQVRNIFEDGPRLVMELELVEGGDIETQIGGRPLNEAVALEWTTSILAGLGALHAAGLVHRDVKLANVLIARDGTLKVTDLGVAHDPVATERTQAGALLGTLETMAPEQIRGDRVDQRADIYACGVVLYKLLVGRSPFEASSQFEVQLAHLRANPDFGPLQRRGVSAATQHCIAVALAKEPGQRFADAPTMQLAIAAARRALDQPPAPRAVPSTARGGPPTAPGPVQKRRISPWTWLLIFFLWVLGILATVLIRVLAASPAPTAQQEASAPRATAARVLNLGDGGTRGGGRMPTSDAPTSPRAAAKPAAEKPAFRPLRETAVKFREPDCPSVDRSSLGEWRITTNVGGNARATRGRYTMRRELEPSCRIRTKIWRDGYTTALGNWHDQRPMAPPWTVSDAKAVIAKPGHAYFTFSARFHEIRVRFHLMSEVGDGAVPGREVGAWTYETEEHPAFHGPAIAERAEGLGDRFTADGYPRVDGWGQVPWSFRETEMRDGVRVWVE